MTLKLDFEKIEFQNRGISLINLGKEAKCWIFFFKKKGKGQFSPIFPQYLNNVTRNLLPNKP